MNFKDQYPKLKAHGCRRLSLILFLYLVLASTYSLVTPIGRGADEWAHYWYAQFIAQHGRLPANSAEREAAGYKSDWPPLYHLFAAGLTAWIETDGPPTFKYRQENSRRQLIPAPSSEAILHTEDEQFPWRQEILVWRLGRFLSISFSLATLLVTYFLALEIFTKLRISNLQSPNLPISQSPVSNLPISQSPNLPISILHPPSSTLHPLSSIPPTTLALVAVALLAFNPRFLFTGMLFNYDSLTLSLTSLFLWLAIRIVNGYYLQWGFFGLGLLAGLALMTKYLTAPLPVIIVGVALLLQAKEKQNRGA
ncbi:MAG: glycosyltransferase family 39 protein, partial [Nitrospira sp.]|nr:glycosyltransferase family 39 protein [Nitrospira sp.]